MNWNDINTYGSLASLLGIIISFIAFLAADSAKKAARKIQDSFLFDKRIPQHLKVLDELLSKYNELLIDIDRNNSAIRTLHSQIKPELSNLSDKIKTKKALNLINTTIAMIDKKSKRPFFKESESHSLWNKGVDLYKGIYLTPHKDIWRIYTSLNEIHWYVNNLKQDRKYLIK